MKKPIVAVFDFDGTLTYADSFLPFLREASNRTTFAIEMLRAIPACLAFFLVGLSRQQLKERLIRRFLCGKSSDELRRIGDRYCADRLRKLFNPTALGQLRWHQKQGHRLVLLSASPEAYLKLWAANNGVSEVLATRIAVTEGVISGAIDGENCRGFEKIKRLEAHLGPLDQYEIYAYGDSQADLALLNRVTHPCYRSFVPEGLFRRLFLPSFTFVRALV